MNLTLTQENLEDVINGDFEKEVAESKAQPI